MVHTYILILFDSAFYDMYILAIHVDVHLFFAAPWAALHPQNTFCFHQELGKVLTVNEDKVYTGYISLLFKFMDRLLGCQLSLNLQKTSPI